MATVNIIHWTYKKNRNIHPVRIRVIKEQEPAYISTGVSVSIKDWNEGKKEVRRSHPEYERLNKMIKDKLSEVEEQVFTIERADRGVTVQKIKHIVKYGEVPEFFETINDMIGYYDSIEKFAMRDNLRTLRNDIELFYGAGKKLYFDKIDYDFLLSYEVHCKTEKQYSVNGSAKKKLKNCHNGAMKKLKNLSELFKYAYKKKGLSKDYDPFENYKLTHEKTERDYPDEVQISQLEKLELEPFSEKWHAFNTYMFSLYFYGLRIGDVLLLQVKNFNGVNKMQVKAKKTGKMMYRVIPEPAMQVLRQYLTDDRQPDDFIFPYLPSVTEWDISNKADKRYIVKIGTGKVQRWIKKIMQEEFKEYARGKKLTPHTARHGFATMMIRDYKTDLPVLQQMLQHGTVKTTERYMHMTEKEVNEGIEVLNSRVS